MLCWVTNFRKVITCCFQADTIIDLLLKESEHMSHHLEPTAARRHVHDVHTLLRVLCHKKDNGASTFLRVQYHLPRSSGETKLVMCYDWRLSATIKHMLLFSVICSLIFRFSSSISKHMHILHTGLSYIQPMRVSSSMHTTPRMLYISEELQLFQFPCVWIM